MRTTFFSLVAVVGLFMIASEADAQQPRPTGMVYIYPDGTTAYQVGPYNYRSGYYVMPTVTQGFRNGSNVIPNQYYQNTPSSNYGQQQFWNGNDRRPYWQWNGYRNNWQR